MGGSLLGNFYPNRDNQPIILLSRSYNLVNCGCGNAYVSRGRSKKILIRRENLSFIYSERLKQQRFKAHKQQNTTSTLRDRIRKLQSWQNLLDLL